MDDLAQVAASLDHQFDNEKLLATALTHPSIDEGTSYQRLEFLGDRVLGLIIAQKLIEDYPDMNEGSLAIRYNELVRRDTLAGVMRTTGLGNFVRLSTGEEESGGRDKPAILADVCEALIGALYLDGGLEAARAFITRQWAQLVASAVVTEKDPKTQLQEWSQARGMIPPLYSELARKGPAHEPIFTIEAILADGRKSEGTGASKRLAEMAAAQGLLAILEPGE